MKNTQIDCPQCTMVIEYYPHMEIDAVEFHDKHIEMDKIINSKTTQELINEFYW